MSADRRATTVDSAQPTALHRLRVEIHGAVQGVGFRPFVFRLATELGLRGWVINNNQGVFIEVEGGAPRLQAFLDRLPREAPPRALIDSLEAVWLAPVGFDRFAIRPSDSGGAKTAFVLPDVATCPDCLGEVLDPGNRRHGYPFTNCTNCGPRFTIVEALPYDRPNTTMRGFVMCPACQREYEDPLDRRFHAQPNACPVCGPQMMLAQGGEQGLTALAHGDEALRAAAASLLAGQIVAVKGLGGFHLMVDAANGPAVDRLRQRKPRRDKPLAVMALDLAHAEALCAVSPQAAALLAAPEAPIVLLPRRPGTAVVEAVAPGNPTLGVMLAYTPLHHLLLRELARQAGERGPVAVVATSGNLTDEPICTDEADAAVRLGSVADLFLVHDRPIARHADDSVAWVVDGAPRLLRRARGYAPLPVVLSRPAPPILAVGAHLKNTVALSVGRQVFISQHIGDLETAEAMAAFERVIADFLRLYEAEPVAIAHDMHPDYLSTRWATAATKGRENQQASAKAPPFPSFPSFPFFPSLVPVQHHHAHLAACLAEHGVEGPALGVTWDGTGYGEDGTVWGGEFLLGDAAGYTRVAHLRPFRLPGGDVAVQEPRRVALALLWELAGDEALAWDDLASVRALAPAERGVLAQMLRRAVNAPSTTSAGRLFDGVAALVGLHQRVSFEGQAAMALEFAVDGSEEGAYPLIVRSQKAPEELGGTGGSSAALAQQLLPTSPRPSPLLVDWQPLLEALLVDLRAGVSSGIIAARFHNSLVEAIAAVAQAVGEQRIVLTGGCFQNRLLTERTVQRLRRAGFEVLLHRQVPPNDGGISLGQVAVAAARLSQ